MPRAAKNPASGLTPQQEEFARACVILGSPARAYRKAYDASKMSQSSVWRECSSLLDRPVIAARVARLTEIADKAAEVSVERIARELARIAFFDPRDLFDETGRPVPINELPEDTARVIAGLDVEALYEQVEGSKVKVGDIRKYKIANKITALEVLAKWKKMLIDRMEVGKKGAFDDLSDEELAKETNAAIDAAIRSGKLKVLQKPKQARG